MTPGVRSRHGFRCRRYQTPHLATGKGPWKVGHLEILSTRGSHSSGLGTCRHTCHCSGKGRRPGPRCRHLVETCKQRASGLEEAIGCAASDESVVGCLDVLAMKTCYCSSCWEHEICRSNHHRYRQRSSRRDGHRRSPAVWAKRFFGYFPDDHSKGLANTARSPATRTQRTQTCCRTRNRSCRNRSRVGDH